MEERKRTPTQIQLEELDNQWATTLKHGDLDRGLDVAIAGYRAAVANGNREYSLLFLGYLRHAASKLYEANSGNKPERSPEMICSFCQRRMPNLVIGVSAAICASCVEEARAAVS